MIDLEKKIKSRREEFDLQEPPEGHFERFFEKLQGKSTRNLYFLKIAALVVTGLFIATATWIFLGFDEEEGQLNAFSGEIKETIYYYNSKNYEMENEIMSLPLENKQEKKQIKEDLKKYDKNYDQLINDLKNFPNDQRIINAIIEYHRSKTEMLEHILYQLKQKNV